MIDPIAASPAPASAVMTIAPVAVTELPSWKSMWSPEVIVTVEPETIVRPGVITTLLSSPVSADVIWTGPLVASTFLVSLMPL